MNVRVRAALEVAGMITVMGLIVAGVQTLLSTAAAAYGTEAVINGLAFGAMSVAAYVCVGLLYDQRVAKLQYKQKLTEMVKK